MTPLGADLQLTLRLRLSQFGVRRLDPGCTLTATRDGAAIVIADAAGTKARITGAEEQKSNGAIHRIDAVLMPS